MGIGLGYAKQAYTLGLPTSCRAFVLSTRPDTFAEAIEAAQEFEKSMGPTESTPSMPAGVHFQHTQMHSTEYDALNAKLEQLLTFSAEERGRKREKTPGPDGKGSRSNSKSKGNPRNSRNNSKSRNNSRSNSKNRSRSDSKKRVCWNCGKEGHYYRECWSPKDSSYGRTRERDAYRAFLDDTSSVQNTNNEQSFNLEKQCKDLQAQLNALQKQQQESHLTQGSL